MLHIKEHPNIACLRFVYPLVGDNNRREILLFNDLVRGGGRDLEKCMSEWNNRGDEHYGSRKELSLGMLDVSLQLARGLAHLHEECSIIHFDIVRHR